MMIPIAKPLVGEDERRLVEEVLKSGQLASGKWVEDFQEKFAGFIGCKFAIATSSGTTALEVALKAAGIKAGDKVLTTPFSFIASSNSILYCGASPVFADIDSKSFNIDPDSIERELAKDPAIKGLLIVHLYGLPCNMDKIMEITRKHKLILIEDCAQAHGAEYNGKKVGSFGHASAFSFYGTKNMTTGEGGMVLTNESPIAEKCSELINHGSKIKYYHHQLGYNYRLTNVAAATGIAQLQRLEEFNQKRRANANFFRENLEDLFWLELPPEFGGYKHVYHQYTLRVENRDKFAEYLAEKGIGYGIHYPISIPNQPLYTKLGYGGNNSPLTEEITKKVISIPVHPGLTVEDLKKIVEVIQNFRA